MKGFYTWDWFIWDCYLFEWNKYRHWNLMFKKWGSTWKAVKRDTPGRLHSNKSNTSLSLIFLSSPVKWKSQLIAKYSWKMSYPQMSHSNTLLPLTVSLSTSSSREKILNFESIIRCSHISIHNRRPTLSLKSIRKKSKISRLTLPSSILQIKKYLWILEHSVLKKRKKKQQVNQEVGMLFQEVLFPTISDKHLK